MVILITGASHTGKTLLAQKFLEQHHFPYLSLDHLKMGLIRSGQTDLTPLSETEKLTAYLWPIAREMIKTAIENKQNLVVEGCYVPFDWQRDFEKEYLSDIRYVCLAMSERYIKENFARIKQHANVIEQRLYDDLSMDELIQDNAWYLENTKKRGLPCIYIDEEYAPKITLE